MERDTPHSARPPQSISTALERLAEELTRCKYSGKTAGTVHIASATEAIDRARDIERSGYVLLYGLPSRSAWVRSAKNGGQVAPGDEFTHIRPRPSPRLLPKRIYMLSNFALSDDEFRTGTLGSFCQKSRYSVATPK